MRKVSGVILGLICLLVPQTVASGSVVPDEQWFAPVDRSRGGLVGFEFSEGFEFQRITTNLSPNFPPGMQIFNSDGTSNLPKVCNGVKDPGCSKAIGFIYHAVFPVCDDTRKLDCIEALWAEVDGKRTYGNYVESIPAKPTTPYSDEGSRDLILGSTPSVWQIPGVTHGGGKDTYAVNTLIAQGSDSVEGSVQFGTSGKFSAAISPVNIVKGNYPALIAGREYPTGDEYRVCATSGDNKCALKQSFPVGTRFGVSIKMSQPPLGWLHGRFKAPVAALEKIQGGVRLSLTGEPVQIPFIAGMFPLTDYPAEFQQSHREDNGLILTKKRGGTIAAYGYFMQGSGVPNIVYQPTLSGTTTSLRLVLPLLQDRSSVEPSIWKFSTLAYFENYSAGICVKGANRLAGIISTNSTTYSDGPPDLDVKTKSLDYELASAHYTSKGEEFLGTYDLVLDAQVARCIYGFSKTPTSATVSIVKNGAVEKVSTTTLTEKDGWLSLAAYGFTFSSPKISVKLNQPADEAPAKLESAVTATPVTKKPTSKTIYCSRGSTKKAVKGLSPKCPKGYKLVK